MNRLSTEYLGIGLQNRLIVSSCPLTEEIGNILKMEDAGESVIMMHSLFKEQLNPESRTVDKNLIQNRKNLSETESYFSDQATYKSDPDSYLRLIQEANKRPGFGIFQSCWALIN